MDISQKVIKGKTVAEWKVVFFNLMFRGNTPRGRKFDLILLLIIVLSVIVVLLDSVPDIHSTLGIFLPILEWLFTIIFTIEYITRIWVSKNRIKYITSFYGIIDLLSILPAYLSIFYFSFRSLLILRSLRLLRIFKILRLNQFMSAGHFIIRALLSSYRKILIFMLFIYLVVIILGSFMYIIESGTPGFESIPDAIYWAVVTITTVGYGDVSPETPFGKFLSIIIMICGYSIIAVPTGIMTAEMAKNLQAPALRKTPMICPRCGHTIHLKESRYCNRCGERLVEAPHNPEDDEDHF